MWEITEDIKYKKEVEEIIKSMEDRILELYQKIEKGNYNEATLPAFFLGLQGDIDEGLKKAKKKIKTHNIVKKGGNKNNVRKTSIG